MAAESGVAGKVCIVTGGAGGLGKDIVKILLEQGAKVVFCDINKKLLDAAKEEFGNGDTVMAVECDITKPDSVKGLIDQTVKTYGQLDVLINNAGRMDKFDPVGDLDQALWDGVLAVNLTAPYMLSKFAIQHFLQRQATSAAIVNIGSLSSKCGFTAGAAYTASKHGLLGLTANTAAFYKNKGIRCNLIMPGGMSTNIVSAFAQGINTEGKDLVQNSMAAMQAPLCTTQEVAKLCVFLASDNAASINGATITADKGWSSMY